MKSASLQEVKKELHLLPPKELVELCLALAKYKRDNKEYLSYLMFEANDKEQFVYDVKALIDEHFVELQKQKNLYYVKKGLRKLLRLLNKYNKFMDDKGWSADLHIYFCSKMKHSGIPYHKNKLLVNLYAQQLKKINSLIAALHEDLRYDYLQKLEQIRE